MTGTVGPMRDPAGRQFPFEGYLGNPGYTGTPSSLYPVTPVFGRLLKFLQRNAYLPWRAPRRSPGGVVLRHRPLKGTARRTAGAGR